MSIAYHAERASWRRLRRGRVGRCCDGSPFHSAGGQRGYQVEQASDASGFTNATYRQSRLTPVTCRSTSVENFRSQTRTVLTKSTKLLTGSEMADLFDEINKTLDRIRDGGAFPIQKGRDRIQKQGRPALPSGSYREYTVKTPGSTDRGSRRVVFDEDSVRAFYTDDHYENFVEISP
jgi:guanyl-specific ribonuclease Sa